MRRIAYVLMLTSLSCLGLSACALDDEPLDEDGSAVGGKADEDNVEVWKPVPGARRADCGEVTLSIGELVQEAKKPYGPPAALRKPGTFWSCTQTGCTLTLPAITFDIEGEATELCLEVDELEMTQLYADGPDGQYVTEAYDLKNARVNPGFLSRYRHFSTSYGTGEVLCQALGMPGGSYYELADSGGESVKLDATGAHADGGGDVWIERLTCRRYVKDRDTLVY